MPPASLTDCRRAAPEPVPGSTNASSLNSTIGHSAPISTSTQPTTAVPVAATVSVPAPCTTPRESDTPMPRISAAAGAMSSALMNQRSDFQNHALVDSLSNPAAAIGVVASSTTRDASRTSITSR